MSMCFYCDSVGELSSLQELLRLYIEETHWIHRVYRHMVSQRDFVVFKACKRLFFQFNFLEFSLPYSVVLA